MILLRILFAVCLISNVTFSATPARKFGEIPLHFEPNLGQTEKSVQFITHTPGMDLYLTNEGAVMVVNENDEVRMKFSGGKQMTGLQKMSGVSNYILGNNPKNWHTGVPHYARVESKDVYPGIDVVYYGNENKVEYDFTVSPGADPNQIHLAFEGASSVKLNEAGDIVLHTASGDVVHKKPRVYQNVGDRQVEIQAKYLLNENKATFAMARYDRNKPLVIDPAIAYSTYLGSATYESRNKIAVDRTGAAYIAGSTHSRVFPLQGELQSNLRGSINIFVTKLNSAGNAVVYSTYLGGSKADYVLGIALDGSGALYLTGLTISPDFPLKGAFQTVLKDEDAFAVKLNPSGDALEYSTYLGGSSRERGIGIAVDSRGAAYLIGSTNSADFPVKNALQPAYAGGFDTFIAKINPTGAALAFSTYFGGSDEDGAAGIALDPSGNICLAGWTRSQNFPTRNAFQKNPDGNSSVFVSKLREDGAGIIYSTYLGGSGSDGATAFAVDATGAAYVGGVTLSPDFPLMPPPQSQFKNSPEHFVSKLSPAGDAVVYSTRMGSVGGNSLTAIAVDSAGAVYAVGRTPWPQTQGPNIASVNPIQTSSLGGPDAFLIKLNPQGSGLVYSTLLGGSAAFVPDIPAADEPTGVAVDQVGNVYITGVTYVDDFPTYNAIFPNAPDLRGGVANFVTKISEATDIRLTKVTIDTRGAVVYIDGSIRVEGTKPRSFFWMPGSTHQLAFSGENVNGVRTTFVSWSDGGAALHTVTTPATDITYTANHDNPK